MPPQVSWVRRCLKSRVFKRWHCVAVSAAPSLHDLVWTEEEMGYFLIPSSPPHTRQSPFGTHRFASGPTSRLHTSQNNVFFDRLCPGVGLDGLVGSREGLVSLWGRSPAPVVGQCCCVLPLGVGL